MQKLTGELYGRAFYECFGLQTLSVRYFNVFGPRQDPKSTYAAAIPAFVTAIRAGRSPTIYGDGEQTRDFSYIENILHANMLAAQVDQTKGQVINIACGEAVSVNMVIRRINELLNTSISPEYVADRTSQHSVKKLAAACSVNLKFLQRR